MQHPHPSSQAPAETCRALSRAYTELIVRATEIDSALSPIALSCGYREEPFIPLHRSTVCVLGSLSRTVTLDEEAFPALLQSLRELYESPWLSSAQLAVLLELAVRTDDLVTAEHHGLTVVAAHCGRVWTYGYGCEFRLVADLWSARTGNTTAYHPKLSQSLRLAQYLRTRVSQTL